MSKPISCAELKADEQMSPVYMVELETNSTTYTSTSADPQGVTVIKLKCPWGTQAMANHLLDLYDGLVYQGYEATDAILDGSEKLGDTIEIHGIYSAIYNIDVEASPLLTANISAPTNY